MGVVLYAQMKQNGVAERRLARRHGLAIKNAPRAACRRAPVEKPRHACRLLGLGRRQRNGDAVKQARPRLLLRRLGKGVDAGSAGESRQRQEWRVVAVVSAHHRAYAPPL